MEALDVRTLLIPLALLLPLTIPALAAEPQEGPMTVVSFDGTAIDILVCKPAGASAQSPAPVILQSHGWGGSRAADCNGFGRWLDAGFGVVSISQRGFGASGGEAHVHDPAYEGRDNIAVIDRVASLEWVMLEGPNDPVMGAIGGSYGGGYQFITALTETAATGSTRLDVLAPEITWYDLPESLAPQDVVRTAWVAALYGAGARDVHPGIHSAFAYGMATGSFPDASAAPFYDVKGDFHGNGPVAFVENGIHLDVPVLIGQGLTDNLFNLNQGWKNFENTLTPEARAQSYFIGYNGGHALPSALPPGVGGSGDPCSAPFGGFSDLTLGFFENVLFGADHAMPATPYSLATTEGACVGLQALDDTTATPLPALTLNTGAAVPVQKEIAIESATVAGVPMLRGSALVVGAEQRLFFALSKGPSALEARILDNNMMPLRVGVDPADPLGAQAFEIELPGIATQLAPGEKLFLTVSANSDMSAAHGSRAPGVVRLSDLTLEVPWA